MSNNKKNECWNKIIGRLTIYTFILTRALQGLKYDFGYVVRVSRLQAIKPPILHLKLIVEKMYALHKYQNPILNSI